MANADKDHTKIDPSHDSTWGSTETAKRAWSDKYADKARKDNAKRDEDA
jgi:hypothetical protein